MQWLVTQAMSGFVQVSSRVPLPLARRIGRSLGQFGFLTLRGRRRIALENVDAAFGDTLSKRDKLRIVRETFENLGIVAMEFAHTPKAGASPIVTLIGREFIDESRGAIFVSAHAANWEWIGPAIASHGMAIAIVVNDYTDSRRGDLINSVREAAGLTTISKRAAIFRITQLLSKTTHVGILADQSVRRNRVPTTFFGRPCWTTVGPAVLALRQDTPIHFLMMRREPTGDYVLEVSPRVGFEKTGDFRRDVAALTQRLQDLTEQHVRKYPGQWLWIHKRWKVRGEDLLARWAQDAIDGGLSPSQPSALVTDAGPPDT